MKTLEVCCGDLRAAIEAKRGGAQRIELCSALPLDGLTPSPAMMTTVRNISDLKMHVLIRPREGNFVYDEDEICVMKDDISFARQCGADGIVIGALTADGDIDVPHMQTLMQSAGDVPVTFHRAFDYCRNPHEALEQIIRLGCKRLLTSGQKVSAEAGIPLLKELVEQASERIIIMPGGGVNELNARRILDETGATEIHSSCRIQDEQGQKHTDARQVEKILNAINL